MEVVAVGSQVRPNTTRCGMKQSASEKAEAGPQEAKKEPDAISYSGMRVCEKVGQWQLQDG
eukprot:7299058-Pyramimonas_sp.AAC.1